MLENKQSNTNLSLKPNLELRKFNINRKYIYCYNGNQLRLTIKQIEILRLVAQGYSNSKIAKKLIMKESTLKITIYRLIKYLECILLEQIDRFYLIIIAQRLGIEHDIDDKQVYYFKLG